MPRHALTAYRGIPLAGDDDQLARSIRLMSPTTKM